MVGALVTHLKKLNEPSDSSAVNPRRDDTNFEIHHRPIVVSCKLRKGTSGQFDDRNNDDGGRREKQTPDRVRKRMVTSLDHVSISDGQSQ